MKRLTITTIAALGILCASAGPAEAWTYPDVYIWDWTFYVSPDVNMYILAQDYSETEIEDWWWTWPQEAGGTRHGQEDHFGVYGSSTLTISFANTGNWEVRAYAENSSGLIDSDYARAHVITVDIDDDPPERDTDEYLLYQSATPADIYYTIEPNSGPFRYTVKLYIKDGGGNAIRTVDLTSLGLGPNQTTWDGKKDDATWAPTGNYTATVELAAGSYGSIKFSASHPLSVYHLQITSPTSTARDVSFNDASPGVCTFTVTGTAGVSSLDDSLKWTLPDMNDPNLSAVPTSREGPSVTFFYTGLPSSNSEFGPKSLILTLDHPGIPQQQVTETIRVFFDPNATNHPVLTGEEDVYNNTPNWFYYWRKGRVVPDLADPNAPFVYDPNLSDYGLYDWSLPEGQGQLRVGVPAAGSYNADYVLHHNFAYTRLSTGRNGINDTPRFPNPQYPIDDIDLID